PEWRPHLVGGFGGFGHHRLVEAGSLRLGAVVILGPLVVLAGEVEGAFARTTETGNIGQDILGRFSRVTLDYPGGRLILELGPDGLGEGSRPDRLGFTAAGRMVVLVWEGSPAQLAGLVEGDVILALDGAPAEGLSGVELAEWASAEPGTPRTLTVLREGVALELSMTTEELW
ncbi:MAG TPA: PDZ domain-containing protein, partial [Candidatus Coatesbacteria bacterium]|nr:PDZ domain-containing protein [Candidatus Coatesbacteria bacterium]